MKKDITGPSLNFVTSKHRDVATSRRRQDSISEIFLDITKITRKTRERGTRYKKEMTT